MEDIESKLGAILNNPEMMQQIMAFAQNFNQKSDTSKQETPQQEPAGFPQIDPAMLQKLTGMAQNSRIDNNQQLLLKALRPYINNRRISKLERAMRAAKMAGLATSFLGASPVGR